MADNWEKTISIKEVEDEDVKEFKLSNGNEIAIFNINNNFHVTELYCTHEKVSLCDGFVNGDSIECPLHQGVFQITTGEVLESPPTKKLKTYISKIENDYLFIDLDS